MENNKNDENQNSGSTENRNTENVNTENKYDVNIVSTKKFNSTKWNMIEKPLSEAEIKRNQIILKLGENISTSTSELTIDESVPVGTIAVKSELNSCNVTVPFLSTSKTSKNKSGFSNGESPFANKRNN